MSYCRRSEISNRQKLTLSKNCDAAEIESAKPNRKKLNVIIKEIPNEDIKARMGFTGADWWIDEGGILQIRIAIELPELERHALALHEYSEALLCIHDGVTVAQVDEFDKKFKGEHIVDVNAGDDPLAPYARQHTFATAIERIFTGAVGLKWKPYEERLSKL